MPPYRFPSLLSAAVLLSIGFFSFQGCSEKPAPPVFSLYEYQRLAILPFENHSHDPALAKEVQDAVTGDIANLHAIPVIDAGQVETYLRKANISVSSVINDPVQRKKLGEQFQCDIFLVGSADGYAETLRDLPPQRVIVNDSTKEAKWGFYTDRNVVVNASAKLFDVATGSLQWTRKTGGNSEYNTWNPLPIPGELKVPDQLKQFLDLAALVKYRSRGNDDEPASMTQNAANSLIYQKSGTFANLRQNALSQTVNYLVWDFRPRGGWTPPPKIVAPPK